MSPTLEAMAGKPLAGRVGKKYPRNKVEAVVPLHEALSQYTAACHVLDETRQLCLKAGACNDTLDLLRESVRNGE